MDTVVSIKIFDRELDRHRVQDALKAAQQEIQRIDSLTSLYSDSSSIRRINHSAGGEAIAVDASVIELLRLSLQMVSCSQGAFDPTLAPIKELWGFGFRDSLAVPDSAQLAQALLAVDATAIVIDSPRVFLRRSSCGIDVSGLAKGYAVDQAIKVLRVWGVRDAMVDAGGDLRTLASDLTQGRRNVYIRHPRDGQAFWGRFRLDVGAVATSGDYERFFWQDSIRYHHILDPRSGYPARDCVSVTVISPSCARSDALSTAVFVLGPQAGLELLRQIPDVEGLIIYEQNGVLQDVMTSGLVSIFEPLHLEYTTGSVLTARTTK